MFHKLRNKFILFNVGITTIVVIIVFSIIYVSTTESAMRRPPIGHIPPAYTNDIKNFVTEMVKNERNNASKELLTILIFSGIAIELCVIIISYFLADIAIKPVKEAYESQKIFIANASHEIKTPLAAISANLEAADIKNNQWIENIEYETKKITSLNDSLLKLAKADTIILNNKREQVDLRKIIEKELKTATSRLGEITLKKSLKLSIKEINKDDFCEVFNILLDNAIKYCSSRIEICLLGSEIIIKNDGKLIPKDKLSHIFERFYQVDKSMEGSGLGLPIAYSIIKRNGWKITAETDDKFNIFTVTI